MNTTSPRFLVPAARRTAITLLAMAAALAGPASAATFDFGGKLVASNLTTQDWVLGSKIWGSIESGEGYGISQSGFNYFATHDITLLRFDFGDLELSSFLSPTVSSGGFERYSEVDLSLVPFTLSLAASGGGSTVIATGTSVYLYAEVSNLSDSTAVGMGLVTLTSPGSDPTFYNEVLALTGGSGQLNLILASFVPENNQGLFTTTGSFTAVPEPGEYAAVSAAALLGLALWRRRGVGSNN